MTGNLKWRCPNCNRYFSRKNQFHSCELYSINDHHLKKANPETLELYRSFIKTIKSFGPIKIEPLKSIIALKKTSQFCSIAIQKTSLKIVFRMYSEIKNIRFNRTSKQKDMYYYEFYLRNINEFDSEVINWLKTAYLEN